MKKVFIKMNLRWGYNNVRIKKGDEWKAVFMMLEGLFEPMVMFFGLTNSLATFQAMINELLRDLINTGKVATFIDNVIVGTEMEEGHNKLVVEVIRKLEANNLYVKLEKCKQKVREVEFLGVVIGLEGIKMRGVLEANTKVCQGRPKVFRISELLSPINTRLCIYCKTITQYGKEGQEVGVNGKAGRGI